MKAQIIFRSRKYIFRGGKFSPAELLPMSALSALVSRYRHVLLGCYRLCICTVARPHVRGGIASIGDAFLSFLQGVRLPPARPLCGSLSVHWTFSLFGYFVRGSSQPSIAALALACATQS